MEAKITQLISAVRLMINEQVDGSENQIEWQELLAELLYVADEWDLGNPDGATTPAELAECKKHLENCRHRFPAIVSKIAAKNASIGR